MRRTLRRLLKKYGQPLKKVFILSCIALVFGTLLLFVSKWEKSEYKLKEDDEAEEQAEDTDATEMIRYNGYWYYENPNIEKILIIGLDKFDKNEDSDVYINDMQADFLAVAAVDSLNNTVSLLRINRDTMTDVNILGVGGKDAGSSEMQIALSHTYGSGDTDSCLNTVKAVSNLLYGVKIDHYVSLTMDAVAKINDGLGGVTVTVEDDFSDIDSTLQQGKTVRLMGSHALTFVRARQGLEDSGNIRRMERQKQYLESMIKRMQTVYAKNGTDSFYNILLSVSDEMTSDITMNQMQDYADRLSGYTFTEIYAIEGEAEQGDVYMEFYVDESALKEQMINLFYSSDEIPSEETEVTA